MSCDESINKRRVKLYVLNEARQWDDKGTGHVTPFYREPLDGMTLVVKNETDGSLLLESKIHSETEYSKQQGSLIVWTESENYDLALSFQEKDGCNEIWEKICEIQGKDPTINSNEESEQFRIEAVRCDYNNLETILNQIQLCSNINKRKEALAEEYLQVDYIAKLIQIFKEAEEKQDLDALHKLYEIFKELFLHDRPTLIEEITSELNLMNVIGIFEYDPTIVATTPTTPTQLSATSPTPAATITTATTATATPCSATSATTATATATTDTNPDTASTNPSGTRTTENTSASDSTDSTNSSSNLNSNSIIIQERKRHREYLMNDTKFKEVIPFGDQKIVDKIHHTYRLQYLQSSVLPATPIFDENTYSSLTNIIFFNKVEIVSLIQEDGKYLKSLFEQIISNSTDFERKRDLILFLREFCTFSHTIQPKQREGFFKTLTSFGILSAIEVALQSADQSTKSAAIDVFTYLVEYSPHVTREHAVNQQHSQRTDENSSPAQTLNDPTILSSETNTSTAANETTTLNTETKSEEETDTVTKIDQTPDSVEDRQEDEEVKDIETKTTTNTTTSAGVAAEAAETSTTLSPSPSINQHDLKEANILRLVISHITNDADPELGTATQLSCIIRLLLDPENMSGEFVEKNSFLYFFYSSCMDLLVEPIIKAAEEIRNGQQTMVDNRSKAQLLSIVLELLSFFAEHHQLHLRKFAVTRDLFSTIMILLKTRHTFLRLSVIKFVRRLVSAKIYSDLIVSENLFGPIIEVFKQNQGRYNLLESAILDMFEFIQNEKEGDLMDYTYKEFGEFLDQITYVSTFNAFKFRQTGQQQSIIETKVTEVKVSKIMSSPDYDSADIVDLKNEDEEVPMQRILKKFKAE